MDIRKIKQNDLRRQVGVVLQEPFLFPGTIADNIAYAKPDATPDEIMRAAKAANAHDFIMRFPDGYDTFVGERGARLSGGERQRLSIARAILHDPRILILDEATASVDTETEKQIQEAIARLIEGRTTFAIAHRLSTLRNASRLMVMETRQDGRTGHARRAAGTCPKASSSAWWTCSRKSTRLEACKARHIRPMTEATTRSTSASWTRRPCACSAPTPDDAVVRLTLEGDRSWREVRIARAFPFSDPDHYIGFRDGDDKDIGLLIDLRGLDAESRRIIDEELARRYFTPQDHAASCPSRRSSGPSTGRWRPTGARAASSCATCATTPTRSARTG